MHHDKVYLNLNQYDVTIRHGELCITNANHGVSLHSLVLHKTFRIINFQR